MINLRKGKRVLDFKMGNKIEQSIEWLNKDEFRELYLEFSKKVLDPSYELPRKISLRFNGFSDLTRQYSAIEGLLNRTNELGINPNPKSKLVDTLNKGFNEFKSVYEPKSVENFLRQFNLVLWPLHKNFHNSYRLEKNPS